MRTTLLCALAVAALLGCADSPAPTAPGDTTPPGLPPTPFVLSNPVTVSGGTMAAYLSLPPGSFGDSSTATVLLLRTGAAVDVTLIDGGFDPVPLAVVAGDTLQVEVRGDGSGTFTLLVPDSAAPVVVRVSPVDHRLHVPVSDSIVVTFSEPIDVASLAGAMTLRHTGTLLPGSLAPSPDALSAALVPTAPLPPLANQVLRVGTGVRDLDGDSLRFVFQSDFTTDSAIPGPIITILSPNAGDTISHDFPQFHLRVTSEDELTSFGIELIDEAGIEPPFTYMWFSGFPSSLIGKPFVMNASAPWLGPGSYTIRMTADDAAGHTGSSHLLQVVFAAPDTQPRIIVRSFSVIEYQYAPGDAIWFYAPQLVVAEAPGRPGLEILGFELLSIPGLPERFPRLWALALPVPATVDTELFPELYGQYAVEFYAPDGRRATSSEASARLTYRDGSGHIYATLLHGSVLPGALPTTYTPLCGHWGSIGFYQEYLCSLGLRLPVGHGDDHAPGISSMRIRHRQGRSPDQNAGSNSTFRGVP